MPADPNVERYAESLLCLAQAEDAAAETEQQLLAILDLVQKRTDLRAFLANPTVADPGKYAALRDMLETRVAARVKHIVLQLQSQDRLALLPAVADRFFAKASAERQRASGRLIAARPVDDETLARVEEAVGQVLGKEVHLLVQQAPSLLGGMRVEIGDFVIDGTLDRHLDDARRALVQ